MRKVAIFFGGRSCENEISILTGVFVLNAIDREKYVPLPVYVHTDGRTYTSEKMTDLNFFREKRYTEMEKIFFDDGACYAWKGGGKRLKRLGRIDVALNCCHGGLGEGGGVSALAAWNSIPFASPDLTSSGVFMDKSTTKLIMRALNIPTVDYIPVNERDYDKRGAFLLRSVEHKLEYPVVVKPAHLGSSIGIAVAKNEGELKRALESAFTLDDKVIVEKYLEGKKDVNCAAYLKGGEIILSEPELAFGRGIYTFEDKYVRRSADRGTPFDRKGGGMSALTGELREKIRAYTRTIYKRTGMLGVVRMDYLLHEGKVYLCEVNTVPGSLAYYFFCDRIVDAKSFFSDLIEEGASQSKEKKRLVTTGILRTVRWKSK